MSKGGAGGGPGSLNDRARGSSEEYGLASRPGWIGSGSWDCKALSATGDNMASPWDSSRARPSMGGAPADLSGGNPSSAPAGPGSPRPTRQSRRKLLSL